jgi:hypothetical protein
MNRPLSRFQIIILSWVTLHRVVIVGLSENDLENEIMLGSVVRKKNLLSSVFCKKCAFFSKFFHWKSAHISRHCKMLATRRFHGTPIVMMCPRLTIDGRMP